MIRWTRFYARWSTSRGAGLDAGMTTCLLAQGAALLDNRAMTVAQKSIAKQVLRWPAQRRIELAEELQFKRKHRTYQPSMSANAFGSDWAQLRLPLPQPSTLNPQPTGDPLNQERHFIPLWLEDAGLSRRSYYEVFDPRDAKDEILAAFYRENT